MAGWHEKHQQLQLSAVRRMRLPAGAGSGGWWAGPCELCTWTDVPRNNFNVPFP